MENFTIESVIGLIAVAGICYFIYTRIKAKKTTTSGGGLPKDNPPIKRK